MMRQVALVTGSTDGLGREVARRLATSDAHIIVHGRDHVRGTALVDEITQAGGSARLYCADFSSLDRVRELACAIRRDYTQLHVLVNNAGILARDRQLSADGHELQFTVNYLSAFLLTRLLVPLLVTSAPSRIVNVASGAQSAIDFDDVTVARRAAATQAYRHSKLALVMFTFDLASELHSRNVTVAALHPATLMDTTMVRAFGIRSQSSVAQGADAVMNLIESPGIRTGQYYDGLRPSHAHPQAYDDDARSRLKRLSLKLTGADVTQQLDGLSHSRASA